MGGFVHASALPLSPLQVPQVNLVFVLKGLDPTFIFFSVVILILVLFKFFVLHFYLFCTHACVSVHKCHSTHVEVKTQLLGVGSHLHHLSSRDRTQIKCVAVGAFTC